MEIFVSTHCSFFDNISITRDSDKTSEYGTLSGSECYNVEQYCTWNKFQEMAEEILNTFLEDLGGGIEELEIALDEISSESV